VAIQLSGLDEQIIVIVFEENKSVEKRIGGKDYLFKAERWIGNGVYKSCFCKIKIKIREGGRWNHLKRIFIRKDNKVVSDTAKLKPLYLRGEEIRFKGDCKIGWRS